MVFIINICIFVEYSRTLGIGLVNSFNQRGPQHLVDKNDQYHQKIIFKCEFTEHSNKTFNDILTNSI